MKPYVIACLFMVVAVAGFAADGEPPEVHVATIDNDGVQRIHIVGGNYFFGPERVVVKVNTPVELSLGKERGVVPHTFVIDAPAAGMAIDEELGDELKKVVFVPTVTGSFPFYCRNRLLFFKSHRDKGMKGILEVVP